MGTGHKSILSRASPHPRPSSRTMNTAGKGQLKWFGQGSPGLAPASPDSSDPKTLGLQEVAWDTPSRPLHTTPFGPWQVLAIHTPLPPAPTLLSAFIEFRSSESLTPKSWQHQTTGTTWPIHMWPWSCSPQWIPVNQRWARSEMAEATERNISNGHTTWG